MPSSVEEKTPMPMIPICLKTDLARPCLVVGGGELALRKIAWLLDCGAQVEVLSPDFVGELDELATKESEKVKLRREEYPAGDLAGGRYQLVIAATDQPQVNRAVAEDARRASVPVNVVDQPELCTFYVPAVVQRGDLQIAISTSGASPSLAARIRGELDEKYPPWHEIYVAALGIMRREIIDRPMDAAKRHQLLN
jgi:precorrin-2 dehydrogenase / sirohydrochlorin ferrochelatase